MLKINTMESTKCNLVKLMAKIGILIQIIVDYIFTMQTKVGLLLGVWMIENKTAAMIGMVVVGLEFLRMETFQ